MTTLIQVVIYCDLDGVLHRWPCAAEDMFDPGCIARFEETIRPYDVGLVVTSTWRLDWSLDRIRDRLGLLGRYLVGVTPDIDDPFLRFGRYHEVLQHRQEEALAESPWIAIDDEAGRYSEDLPNLILTDPKTGGRRCYSRRGDVGSTPPHTASVNLYPPLKSRQAEVASTTQMAFPP